MKTNSPMQLLYSGSYGVYIPQTAASELNFTEPLTDEQKHDLSDPENEGYWFTWEEVLNKTITDIETGLVYNLHQDDDLWAIQIGYHMNDDNELVNSETNETIEP